MRIARRFLFIPLFCMLIVSFGCATKTISRADFQELNHSTSELRSQADAALEELEDAAREGFVKGEPLQVGDAPDDPKGLKPSELQLQWDQNPFRPTMKKPLFTFKCVRFARLWIRTISLWCNIQDFS